MKEVASLISEEDFRKEMETLEIKVREKKDDGSTYGQIICFLAGWVGSPAAKIHTPGQLKQIFDLAE